MGRGGGIVARFVNMLVWVSRKRRVGAGHTWNRFVQTLVAVSLGQCKYEPARLSIIACVLEDNSKTRKWNRK